MFISFLRFALKFRMFKMLNIDFSLLSSNFLFVCSIRFYILNYEIIDIKKVSEMFERTVSQTVI